MFDASIAVPVTIRDPEKPNGTHVCTAMPPARPAFAGPQSTSTKRTTPKARSTRIRHLTRPALARCHQHERQKTDVFVPNRRGRQAWSQGITRALLIL